MIQPLDWLSWRWAWPAALALALLAPPLSAFADGPLPVGPEFQVNTYITSTQRYPKITMDAEGDFVIAWESFGQDGSSTGIYARQYNANGLPQDSEFRVNTYITGTQRSPEIAMAAEGDFVIVWDSYHQDGSYAGVYGQRYNASGVPQGSEFRVNTYTTGDQFGQRVAMDADGDFVVVWESYQDGSGAGVYAQRYNASGAAQGSEFQVNTSTTGDQFNPHIAMDAGGNFAIVWEDRELDGSQSGVYAQRYNASGLPQGNEFRVNTQTINEQRSPRIAMDADGDFVTVWESYDQDGSHFGVYAQRYNASGVTQGNEFRVNSYTTDIQFFPSVAMDAGGNFVVTWVSYYQDGSWTGVFAQRYNASGAAQESEFQVNTYTIFTQFAPSVAMDADGNFVITWFSAHQDGSGDGVYAQRYNDPPALTVTKRVDDAFPRPGQPITYTITVSNTGQGQATHALISDTLPAGLIFIGPVTLDPPGSGTPGSAPPILASNLTISPNQSIRVTFPVSVSSGLAAGASLTNTASVTSSEVITPQVGQQMIIIGGTVQLYLPVILKAL